MHNLRSKNPAGEQLAASSGRSAFWHLPSQLRLWLVAALGLGADLASKAWAFRDGNVSPEGRSIIPDILSFELSLNSGALFGLGRGMSPLFVAASVLALMFVLYLFAQSGRNRWSLHIALGFILGGALGNLYDRSVVQADVVFGPPAGGFLQRLLGDHPRYTGILKAETDNRWVFGRFPDGNDHQVLPKRGELRLVRSVPVVRDFIKIDASILGYDIWKWIFNVADVLLVAGVGLLLLNFWQERRLIRSNREAAANVSKPGPSKAM